MDTYEEIALEAALELPAKDFQQASHVLLYAELPGALFGKYHFKYAVMMQVRFDGTLGFPGGVVDEGETPEEAVSREIREEMGGGVSIGRRDHVISNYSHKLGLCLHFYSKQLSLDNFKELESQVTQAKDWGNEVLGIVRCPLYTLPNGLGFPAFLCNRFIGNSRFQLLHALKSRGLLSSEEVKVAVEKSLEVNALVSKDEINY